MCGECSKWRWIRADAGAISAVARSTFAPSMCRYNESIPVLLSCKRSQWNEMSLDLIGFNWCWNSWGVRSSCGNPPPCRLIRLQINKRRSSSRNRVWLHQQQLANWFYFPSDALGDDNWRVVLNVKGEMLLNGRCWIWIESLLWSRGGRQNSE